MGKIGKMITQVDKKPTSLNKGRLNTIEQENEEEDNSDGEAFPKAPNEFGFGAFKQKISNADPGFKR